MCAIVQLKEANEKEVCLLLIAVTNTRGSSVIEERFVWLTVADVLAQGHLAPLSGACGEAESG